MNRNLTHRRLSFSQKGDPAVAVSCGENHTAMATRDRKVKIGFLFYSLLYHITVNMNFPLLIAVTILSQNYYPSFAVPARPP